MDRNRQVEGPGYTLRSARERAGFTIEYVARSLNLEKSVVEALEEDDISHLPEPAYVKGYLRAYARLLELDAKSLMEAYGDLGVPSPEVIPLESVAPSGDHRVGVQVIGGLVALVLIVLSGWWFTRPRPTPVPAPQAKMEQQTDQASKPGLAGDNTLTGKSASEVTVPSTETSDSKSSRPDDTAPTSPPPRAPSTAAEVSAGASPAKTAETPPVVSSKSPSATVVPKAGGATVSLQLNEKSWVQIQDGSGKQLVRGLLGAGTHRVLTGTPPFSVFLGYAPGVVLRVDGHTVDAGQYTRSNHTARFILSADGNTHR